MTDNSYVIGNSTPIEELNEIAMCLIGKVEFTKDDPIIEIPITGKLILDFSGKTQESIIIKMESKK